MLIGLTGAKGCGKTTGADGLCNAHGFKTYALATPLKEAAKILFQFSALQVEDPILKETVDPRWGFTPRHALQKLGTECIRKVFREDFWIKNLEVTVDPILQSGQNVVISDVRFDNEARWILDKGGVVIRVVRPGLQSTDSHPSEQGVSQYLVSATVFNDGTPDDLASMLILVSKDKLKQ